MPRALLVEDDQPTLQALTSFVERSGFNADVAGKWDAARDLLVGGDFDVVLLDVFLPGGSGIDLLMEVPRERRPQVILMSGDHSVGSAFAAMPMQELHFLPKPVDLDQLGKTLRAVRRKCKTRTKSAAQKGGMARLIGESIEMRRLRTLVKKVAPTELSTYIEGESGTGKELVARAIHEGSPRASGPFVAVNCGALPENLIDSELFGYEKGAFTGADAARTGLFEQADGGTLFLDEVAEMPVELQVRLLRTLETGAVRRVGGRAEIPIDVRIVAATNRPVDVAIADGKLREDLFHRLCVFPIATPPLRSRGKDVLLLAERFLVEMAGDGAPVKLSPQTRQILLEYDWPGNVRQLRNAMQRVHVLAEGLAEPDCLPDQILAAFGGELPEPAFDEEPEVDQAPASDEASGGSVSESAIPGASQPEVSDPDKVAGRGADTVGAAPIGGRDGHEIRLDVGTSIADAERRLIERTLAHHDGDKKMAAEVLGVSLRTLYNRLNEYAEADGAEGAAGSAEG